MAARLVNIDRQMPMLLPPDLREWVADDDLAQLVLQAVKLCDMARGAAQCARQWQRAISSEVMMGLLSYAYATGLFSSRRIERATYGFRTAPLPGRRSL
jgi:hypothetical protein